MPALPVRPADALLRAVDSEPAPAWSDWPVFGLIDDVRPTLAAARERGGSVAVATLFASEGGSPRGVGAQMVIGDDVLAGHLTGGCVDADIANHGRAVLASGTARRLVYGRGGPWDLPLPCGGRIEVFVERVDARDEALGALLALHARRQPGIWISDGAERSCIREGAHRAALPATAAGTVGRAVFRRHDPAVRLVVVGGDPTALAIAGSAAAAGIETTLVRPDGPREPPPLTGVAYSRRQPADALADIGIDGWTAVAACTHDLDLDHATLVAALRSPAFYVGALGSERRKPERVAALMRAGVSADEAARLHNPIGFPIGARAPSEIAIAALAELIAAAHAMAAERLRCAS